MKSVILMTLAVLAVSVTANPVEENQICVKTTDKCKEFAETAKLKIHELRSVKIVNPQTDIKLYLTKLRELLRLASTSDCHVDVCKCANNALACDQLLNKIRGPLAAVQLPTCLDSSVKATEIVNEFKKAVAERNRAGIVEVLDKINATIETALATKSDEESKQLVSCLVDTVKGIRTAIDAKIAKLNPRPNCDFCVLNDAPSANAAVLHARA